MWNTIIFKLKLYWKSIYWLNIIYIDDKVYLHCFKAHLMQCYFNITLLTHSEKAQDGLENRID